MISHDPRDPYPDDNSVPWFFYQIALVAMLAFLVLIITSAS